jgi:phosphoribosylanthranilate isomerase
MSAPTLLHAPGRTRIKICGITDPDSAGLAAQCGADALGFMFYPPSPRFISFEAAAAIIAQLPPFVARVGVFVDPTPDAVHQAIDRTGIDTLQFHGNESPDFCARFPLATIKAFRVRDRTSLAPLSNYPCAAWLLDSYVPGQLGGSGNTFNWVLAREAAASGHPILLAGGLTPDNISQAIQTVRPFAVDVSSGVESAPGRKDPDRIRQFIAQACDADRNS